MIDQAASSLTPGMVTSVLCRSAGVSPSRSSADFAIATLTSIRIGAPNSSNALRGPERITYSSPAPSTR